MVIDPFICIVDIIPAAAPNQDTNTDQAHNLCITWSNYLHWWGLRLIGWILSVVKLATSFPITIRKGTIKCSLICTNNVSWTHCMLRLQIRSCCQFWHQCTLLRFTRYIWRKCIAYLILLPSNCLKCLLTLIFYYFYTWNWEKILKTAHQLNLSFFE